MNYNPFPIEAEILLNKLNKMGYEPISVDNGVEVIDLVKKNRTDFLGHNARLDEAVSHIMSVDDSTVVFKKPNGVLCFSLYLVRGNSPGELVNDILFDAKAAYGPKVRFENAVKEAAEEFVTWVNINDAFVFDKVGIAYALGMTLEEAAETYGG